MKSSSYQKWLRKEIGEKNFLEELNSEEIYKIILKISQIVCRRHYAMYLHEEYTDTASAIYCRYLQRDFEREFSSVDYETPEYPNCYEGRYFKWVPREVQIGFNKMLANKMDLTYFSNLIFKEVDLYCKYELRKVKFKIRQTHLSLDSTEDSLNLHEVIGNKKAISEEISNQYEFWKIGDSFDKEDQYIIVLDDMVLPLSPSNLIKLYGYLFEETGKRVTSKLLREYIFTSDGLPVNTTPIEKEFKEYLINKGLVKVKSVISNGKEVLRHDFT